MQNSFKTKVLVLTLLITQMIGLALFARGFFPYKSYLSGFSEKKQIPPLPTGAESLLNPKFSRLVFMLIDALRSDFVYGENSGMTFVNRMIAERRAIPFTALATAPTVTLPRIKALTTGAIPNFLDAILNIAESDTSSSLAHQDNWLIQMKRTANMNISFFGDDTWIKLFPNIFHTTDGTTSFVTADTVEVDLNVTRHVLPELKKPHWDVLIFHYLGLDHIGHSSGPHSPMMKPKQIEMDDIVKTIFETISEQDNKRAITDSNSKPTLFVLCGDHGMNELGNHGGASKGEISTAIVFMSSAFGNFTRSPKTYETPHNVGSLSFYDLINQIDLVPTICFLFGIPIPKNNLGKIVLQVGDLDGITSLRALQLNARQIAVILQTLWTSFNINFHKSDLSHISDIACDSIVEEKNRLQCLYDQAHQLHAKAYYTGSAEIIERSLYLYEKFIDEASSRISSSSREYGLGSMYCGIIVITFATCWFIALLIDQYKSGESETVALRIHRFWTRERSLGFFGAIGLSVTMFASSYIEEEHQFWYFWMQTLWIGFLVKSIGNHLTSNLSNKLAIIGQLVCLRLIRSWNQTGQKYAGEIDLGHYLKTSHIELMWIFFFGTILFLARYTIRQIWISLHTRQKELLTKSARILNQGLHFLCIFMTFLITFLLISYKTQVAIQNLDYSNFLKGFSPSDLISEEILMNYARTIYIFLLTLFITITCIRVVHGFQRPSDNRRIANNTFSRITLCVVTYMLILLSRPHNVPLFALFAIQLYLFIYIHRSFEISGFFSSYYFTFLALQNSSFFALGNSNSLASVDLSNAYIGIRNYNVVWVGVLTFLANWAGPIWWAVASNLIRQEIINPRNLEASGQILFKGTQYCSINFKQPKPPLFLDYILYTSTFHAIVLLILSIAMMIFRNHLFVWTVFSPKYLYQIVWNILHHFGIEVVVCGLLDWVEQ